MRVPEDKVARRTMLASAGAAGALAAAAALAPGRKTEQAPKPEGEPRAGARPAGYRLSEHVKKYYRAARV